MAVPKVVFDQLGLWDETAGLQADDRVTRQESRFYEDTELQDRVRGAGGSTWFCPEAIVHHRVNRQSITPRRLLSAAFSRGRNEFWQQRLRVWDRVELVPKRNALESVLALGVSLVRWGFWLIPFRFSKQRRFFERAWRAAFISGRSLDSLRAGRTSMRWFLSAARVAFPARSLLVRELPSSRLHAVSRRRQLSPRRGHVKWPYPRPCRTKSAAHQLGRSSQIRAGMLEVSGGRI